MVFFGWESLQQSQYGRELLGTYLCLRNMIIGEIKYFVQSQAAGNHAEIPFGGI